MTGTHERKEFKGGAKPATLLAGITDTDTSLVLQSAVGWPDGTTGPFVVCIDRGTSLEEKMLCSSRTNNQINIVTRGYDDTTAVAHTTTANSVEHVLDASTVDQANRYANLQSAKGDIVVHNGINPANLPVGANGTVLKVNVNAASGVEWGTIGADQLSSTGVTAGTYGDGSNSVQLTVDADGRITSASNVSIGLDISDVTNLSTTLAGKSNTDHTHNVQSHTHNEYAPTSHNHDGDYASVHSHPYASTSHNHDSDYSGTTHNHSGSYLPLIATNTTTYLVGGNYTAFTIGSARYADNVALQVTGPDASISLRSSGAASANSSCVQMRVGQDGSGGPGALYITGYDGQVMSSIHVKNVYYTGGSLTSTLEMKENVAQAHPINETSAYDKVKDIELATFNYINQDENDVRLGVIAEELYEVAPEFIELEDEKPRYVKDSIHFMTMAALRQAINKIETLESRINELEN